MTKLTQHNTVRAVLVSGAAALGLAFAAPAAASDFGNISFNGINVDINSEDFLQRLIDMDAEDIAELRAEMADARADIKDAIADIDEAREEASQTPEAKAIFAAALAAASSSVSSATDDVFDEVRTALDRAETELNDGKIAISAEEDAETRMVIATLREELTSIETALGELVAAMKA